MITVETLNVSAPVKPPQRLSEKTRYLAMRGLSGEFGRELVNAQVKLDDLVDTKGMSEEMKYAQSVKLIAETAPLRILPDELVIGSATYRESAYHATPIWGGGSTSHLTLGFDRILKIGYSGLRKEINDRLSQSDLDDKGVDLLNSMLVCLDATQIWHQRHIDLLEKLI
ncbi:MAG: hypothetical protein QG641_2332, partial [Candidatus Poribacteria bacterium]|nr:hypothetical protein [Candidatus Poribacteria bacterium]